MGCSTRRTSSYYGGTEMEPSTSSASISTSDSQGSGGKETTAQSGFIDCGRHSAVGSSTASHRRERTAHDRRHLRQLEQREAQRGALQAEVQRLGGELARLTEAVAAGGGDVRVLVDALKQKQRQRDNATAARAPRRP